MFNPLYNLSPLYQDDAPEKKTKLTSSGQFFSQLQDQVSTHIQKRKQAKGTETKSGSDKSAAKYKL